MEQRLEVGAGEVLLQELGQGGPREKRGKGAEWGRCKEGWGFIQPSLHLEFGINHSDEEEHCGLARKD